MITKPETAWLGFKGHKWQHEIDVRDFIQDNYHPYLGDESFLEGPTDATNVLWGKLSALQKEERAKGGVLDMETEVVSSLTAYGPGYISEETKDLEKVVGLQTDKPLKRAFMPYGGIKMAEKACTTYGYQPSEKLHEIFTKYHKTHNDGVFDVYTDEMMRCRHNKIITGLPDTYGRGRIVGDYRRVALYGIDNIIAEKIVDLQHIGLRGMTEDVVRLREEVAMQIRALKEMKEMAKVYGFDMAYVLGVSEKTKYCVGEYSGVSRYFRNNKTMHGKIYKNKKHSKDDKFYKVKGHYTVKWMENNNNTYFYVVNPKKRLKRL